MGTTLENGVYLPSEGERNCYAGLKTNWEILDQKVADVTALQQAVAGALHREIVESLPTTDIDPNTIYMVLSGTSATENVYNEYMYVNNAWELIGTSATDLTNYYTKAEVDGKLLLKASASDLTSHTGDTTIHVTASDKNRWNNQTYVFRYSSTALVASSTNSNALLDNTDNLKVGDKVIDSSGVLFSITAIDTQNSTFSIGTALVDLAQDSDVVHKTGDETIAGVKTFSDDTYITSLNFTNNVASPSSSASSTMPIINTITYTSGDASVVARLNFRVTADGTKSLYPNENNQYLLGLQLRKWKEVHAIEYYYGSSDTEFSTKFVTTDTAQTISGSKNFTDGMGLNSWLYFTNTSVTKGTIPQSTVSPYRIYFGSGVNYGNSLFNIDTSVSNTGVQTLTLRSAENVVNGDDTRLGITYDPSLTQPRCIRFKGDCVPSADNTYECGTNSNKWKSINGLNPSSLGMPDLSNGVDISSYIPALVDGRTQGSYTPSVNGFITFRGMGNGCSIVQGNMGNNVSYVTDPQTSDKVVNNFLPVIKDNPVVITARGLTSIEFIYFYPCQGNV